MITGHEKNTRRYREWHVGLVAQMEGGIGCGELPRSAFCGYHASDSKSTGTRNSPDEAFDSFRAARLFRRHAIPCGATQAAQNDSRQGQGGRLSILPLVDHVEGAGSAYDGRPIVGIGSTYGRMAIRDRGRAGLPRRGLCASFATLLCGPGLSSSRPLSAVRGLLAIRRHVRDRKSTRLNSSHVSESRMPSSA